MNKAIFLDRDGTIIKDRGYLSDPDKIELLPNAGLALRDLQQRGFKLIIITNQSGIARKLFTKEKLYCIHKRLRYLLSSRYKVIIDAIYYSPGLPDSGSKTRKPSPLLAQKACKKFDILPRISFVIGDKDEDVQMGRNLGVITMLLDPTVGETTNVLSKIKPHYVCKNLYSASQHILRRFHVAELFAPKFVGENFKDVDVKNSKM